MSVHVISVDATRIVPTLLEATPVPATLVMKSIMITEPALVRISPYACMFDSYVCMFDSDHNIKVSEKFNGIRLQWSHVKGK